MNNAVFRKTMGKHKHIKLETRGDGRNYFVSEPNYHTTKCSGDLLTIEMKTKNKKKKNKKQKKGRWKELFRIRTKLSYNKMFWRLINHRNENKKPKKKQKTRKATSI